jgi:hypothetical protein
MSKLGLVLHPEKTRMVDLRRGKGSFVFLGCTIRKKRSILRNPRAYYMHRWPSPKATKRLRDRVREITDQRASGADVKQIIAKLNRASRLGELLSDGNIVTRVPENGQLRLCATGPLAVSAGRAASDAAGSMDSRTVSRNGPVSIARYRALPGASRIRKIIVKPCAGKPHARFERGLLKTGWR